MSEINQNSYWCKSQRHHCTIMSSVWRLTVNWKSHTETELSETREEEIIHRLLNKIWLYITESRRSSVNRSDEENLSHQQIVNETKKSSSDYITICIVQSMLLCVTLSQCQLKASSQTEAETQQLLYKNHSKFWNSECKLNELRISICNTSDEYTDQTDCLSLRERTKVMKRDWILLLMWADKSLSQEL